MRVVFLCEGIFQRISKLRVEVEVGIIGAMSFGKGPFLSEVSIKTASQKVPFALRHSCFDTGLRADAAGRPQHERPPDHGEVSNHKRNTGLWLFAKSSIEIKALFVDGRILFFLSTYLPNLFAKLRMHFLS